MSAMAAGAQGDYNALERRANRFFEHEEWASASACYNFMLQQRPETPDIYGRDIVSYLMLNDTVQPQKLLTDAMAYKIPLDTVLSYVRKYSFALGRAPLYEHFMLTTAATHQWLVRPLNNQLLKYYLFRNDGPRIEQYARRMLNGAPDNIVFLEALAKACMLQERYDEAVDIWRRILDIAPDNYNALVNLAGYYSVTGSLDRAMPYIDRALAIRPNSYLESLKEK